ncbi:STAS domain-containing protein [Streptomyces purpureus]|uniref:STAS domain-containing protein n=1 Tax=Streptomyces purpureus TaxID=1951 RepID=A0A918GXS1_9ACTN|nr:STAS domain-containing protein [Streptomyces purpureus]GGT15541.1 hypothetical protein GCM10014713_05440 [Streptomyces purpureus]
MSTSSTRPILASSTPHNSGADNAPSDIVVHSCTSLGETTLVIHLTGQIDHYSAAPLRAMLTSAAADGYTVLVLEASRVTFCDSGLLNALQWWERRGHLLHFTARSSCVQRLLNAADATAGRPWGPGPKARADGPASGVAQVGTPRGEPKLRPDALTG